MICLLLLATVICTELVSRLYDERLAPGGGN